MDNEGSGIQSFPHRVILSALAMSAFLSSLLALFRLLRPSHEKNGLQISSVQVRTETINRLCNSISDRLKSRGRVVELFLRCNAVGSKCAAHAKYSCEAGKTGRKKIFLRNEALIAPLVTTEAVRIDAFGRLRRYRPLEQLLFEASNTALN